MIIDAYVNMCRVHDRALSNHDLTYLGKAGYALRGRVATVFSDWRTFRQRVAAVHPDMPAEPLPIARDGTLLDSFAEVAVYHALRAGLPADTCIIPHVLIGVAACSSDFVVAERVVVEVLMLALAEIASPRSQTQVAYAAKWMRKVAIYAERGTALVVIEPADANTAVALAAKVAEVARLLRLPDPPPPISVVAGRIRPKGWWSHATLCRVLGQVAAEVGQFPTFGQLTARGYGHATNLLKRRGCRMRVSHSIGWPTTVRKRPARSRPT